MIRLVTRGDDSGSSRSANRAILEAFEKGILRNTSMMACGPEVEDAARLLGAAKGLCIGLHVTLNSEWDHPRWGPVLPREQVPSLLDADGNFFRTTQALADNNPSIEEMVAEAQAQLDRLRGLGLEVAYLDDHMGVGWIGGLSEQLSRLAEREGLIDGDSKGLARLPRPRGPEGPRDSRSRVKEMVARLEAAEDGTYVAVGHPAYDDEEMRSIVRPGHATNQISIERDGERRMFMDPAVLDICRRRNIEAIRYDEI